MLGAVPIPHDPEAATVAIGAVRGLDLRTTSIERIKELLIPVFRGYAVTAPIFEPGLALFRSQICDKPANIGRLSYPPMALTRLGRANREGEPVLYCSTSREAPFFESRPEENTTVAVVRWITTAPLLVNHVGYTHSTFRTLGSNRPNAGWGADCTQHLNETVSEFLAEVFTRIVPRGSEQQYKVSVAIAEKLFADGKFDGLLYPAVAVRANSDNFALKPRYADKNLQFDRAEFARIDRVRDLSFDIRVLDTATELASDGTILWKGRLDQWVLKPSEELIFTAENGGWVARDASGRVVASE